MGGSPPKKNMCISSSFLKKKKCINSGNHHLEWNEGPPLSPAFYAFWFSAEPMSLALLFPIPDLLHMKLDLSP